MVTHLRVALLWPMGTFFWGLSNATVILVAASFGPRWGISFGRATAFLFLADLFVQSFTELPEIYGETQSAISGWRKILALLAIPVEIVEPTPGITLPEGTPLPIEAAGVTYRYGDADLVLHGVAMTVAAGAHVVIVGETGSGKSTFVKLLTRLADPVEGTIRVGGVDLREVARASRQQAIRMVPQDGFLFDTSIRENVRAGREGASDREVEASFEELGLASWLATLPEGLETRVGERGMRLSGGERQRISIARAFLKDAPILLLDEPTEGLDAATESQILHLLAEVLREKTVLMVTHRLRGLARPCAGGIRSRVRSRSWKSGKFVHGFGARCSNASIFSSSCGRSMGFVA